MCMQPQSLPTNIILLSTVTSVHWVTLPHIKNVQILLPKNEVEIKDDNISAPLLELLFLITSKLARKDGIFDFEQNWGNFVPKLKNVYRGSESR